MSIGLTATTPSKRGLGHSKLFLDALIDAIPSPVLVKDHLHRFIAVNTAFTVFFRRSAEEILGRNDYDFFLAEDAEFFQSTDIKALEQGDVVEYEHTYTLEGSTRWMLVRKCRMICPDESRVVVLLLDDITERRKADQALRQSEARFRSLTTLSADWYWEQDAQFRFTFVSTGANSKSGQLAVSSRGLTRWDHPGVDHSSADWEEHKATCQTHGSFRDFTYRRTGEDGVPRWITISGEPVFDAEGCFSGYQGVGRDVTGQRQVAQEIVRRKDLYAALSHTNRAIIHIHERQTLFEEVCRVAVEYGHFCLVWVGLVDEHSSWVRLIAMRGPASHGYPPIRVSVDPSLPEGRGFSAAALREGNPYIVNDYFADPRVAPWAVQARAAGVRSMATFPLKRDGRCVGLLNLHGDEVGFFTDELVSLLQEMADNLSFALANIQREAERETARRALADSEQKFQQLASNIPEVFWIAEPRNRRITYVSPAYEQLWGRSAQRLLDNSGDWLEAVHRSDRERVEITIDGASGGQFDHQYRIVRPDASVRWIHDRAFPILGADGEVVLITGIAKDITAQKEAEERLLFLAHFDNLTRLPNRPLFYDRLTQALAHSRRTGCVTAVIFLDLDHFKRVNDTLGHGPGDLLLQEVAKRLKETLRTDDTVGRLGGDEFALILSDLASPDDVSSAMQKVMHALEQPIDLDGHEVFITASAGIALSPEDGIEPDTLIKKADTAMYRAKQMGRTNHQFYKSEMNERSLERMSLDGHLRRALERNEFVLHYQPKVDLATGQITGLEALLRWQHAEFGLVAPARFISILEDNGLIVQVGEWVLGEACRQLDLWSNNNLPGLRMALNLSARQLQQRGLESSIQRIVSAASVDPHLIELEITESVLMREPEQAARILRRLKDMGIRLSIDDFGTGYSSLSYLKSFPLDALKIDRTFVKDLVSDSDDAAIVQAIIALARSLKLRTIAEGVEELAQLALLKAFGCDEYQGYYFSRPLPADQITQLLGAKRDLAAKEVK